MAEFNIEKKIQSCHITKEIISQLEDYITNRVPEIADLDRGDIRRSLSISIEDKIGTQTMSSISEYGFPHFPDTTKLIKIELWIVIPSPEKSILIRLNLSKDGYFAYLNIKLSGDNPRETVIGIFNSIKEIIKINKNRNKIFHLHTSVDAGIVPSLIVISIIIALRAFLMSQYKGGFLFSFIAFFFISYYFGKLLKPYITFDSNRYNAVRKLSDKIFWGLFTFIIFGILLSTLWFLVRKEILGF